MKLAGFSVQKYRSIVQAQKLPLTDLTILIGPNNEGKSNLLRALVVGMRVLSKTGNIPLRKTRTKTVRLGRLRDFQETYDWEEDFPVSLRDQQPNGRTIFDFEFELDGPELLEFRDEFKSNLNGLLPIRLFIDRSGSVDVRVKKQGPAAAKLTQRSDRVARFIGMRLRPEYIPSVRTAEAALRVVDDMVSAELGVVQMSSEFQKALSGIEAIQRPVLNRISNTVRETLRGFLPEVVDVAVDVEDRQAVLRRNSRILVDDGTLTDLSLKGDGVQSLAAISLIKHASETATKGGQLLLALEEPEAHLHPMAVHRLRQVLRQIASRQQVILTTHSPLFVNRYNVSSNVIVENSRARSATSISEVRRTLGVRVSDNLQSAELILVVEGELDRRALEALLSASSDVIRAALGEGTLAFESLAGAANLSYKLTQVQGALCKAHTFLDDDEEGRRVRERAEIEGLLDPPDVTMSTCRGRRNSELEDMYRIQLYADSFREEYNVTLEKTGFNSSGAKWSDRMRDSFLASGQVWNEAVERQCKRMVAELVEESPADALGKQGLGSFGALQDALELKLKPE